MLRAVLFDLDGTLVDTAPDLVAALNATRRYRNLNALAYETIRPVVSHGGNAILKAGFNITPEDAGFDELRTYFLEYYKNHICEHSTLFDGMAEVLEWLENKGIYWGIVTNKPAWLTQPLADAMQLNQRAASIVSGDTTSFSKPHPEPLLHACKEINVKPEECLYVGDAERDIEAGRRAGMKTIGALFGYIQDTDDPLSWRADCYVNQPTDLIECFIRLTVK